jgi:hypothetical protein
MTYHLYFPARWIQAAAIEHIPTVFGDNAAAFAPQNGALIHAWSMSLLGSDALTNTLSGIAIAAAMVALWSLSRTLGARARPAAWVVGWTVLLQPVMRESIAATVDALAWSIWILSLALAARYAIVCRPGLIGASGIALGFAAGTKTVAVPLAAMLGTGVAVLLVTRRAWRDLAIYSGCAAMSGMPWFLRNFLLYGNPLFPLHVQVGPLTFPGAYDSSAVRAGEFYIGDTVALLQHLARSWTWPTIAVGLLGFVFLIASCLSNLVVRQPRRAWPNALTAGLAFAAFAYYLLVVPHNMETRFAVPALLLALCGWAVVLTRLRERSAALPTVLWSLMTLALLPHYFRHVRSTYMGVRPGWLLAVVAVGGAAWALRWAVGRWGSAARQPVLRRAAALASAVALIVVSMHAVEASRFGEYRRVAGTQYSSGYLHFVNADIPPATIVYTGFNVPYVLIGPRLRHRVVYCNVSGEIDDGFYEFWRREPRLHRYYRPPIYRANPDFDVWMECVRRVSADYVAVYALHPGVRGYMDSDDDGFPIERGWIRNHPELFAPVRRSHGTEIYAVQHRNAPH